MDGTLDPLPQRTSQSIARSFYWHEHGNADQKTVLAVAIALLEHQWRNRSRYELLQLRRSVLMPW